MREGAVGDEVPSKLDLGPQKAIHAFWLAGMSCDGCSIAVVGATSPSAEMLMAGTIPGMPKVVLHHPVLAVEAGEAFVENFRMAERGELGAPYVVIYEGSVPDERIAEKTGGYWSALGADEAPGGQQKPIPRRCSSPDPKFCLAATFSKGRRLPRTQRAAVPNSRVSGSE